MVFTPQGRVASAAPLLFPRIVLRNRRFTSCGIVPTPVFTSPSLPVTPFMFTMPLTITALPAACR